MNRHLAVGVVVLAIAGSVSWFSRAPKLDTLSNCTVTVPLPGVGAGVKKVPCSKDMEEIRSRLLCVEPDRQSVRISGAAQLDHKLIDGSVRIKLNPTDRVYTGGTVSLTNLQDPVYNEESVVQLPICKS